MTRATTARGGMRWQFDLGEPVVALTRTPQGVVAGGSEGAVVAVDHEGAVLLRWQLGTGLLALAASPDGTRVAAGGIDELMMWDLADGSLVRRCDTGWCENLAWTDRSDQLAAADGRQIRVLDRSGVRCWTSTPLRSTVAGLSWVRGGRRIAAAAYQGVNILEPATDRLVEHLAAPGAIAGLAVSPNGRWVVGGSQDATLHGWKVPGGDDFEMRGFPTTVSRLAFEDSGRWMACDGGTEIACWDFAGSGPTGREAVLAEGHGAPVSALDWRPGQTRTLVSGDTDGRLARWRLDPSVRGGERIRPMWSVDTGDPISTVVTGTCQTWAGHRSGILGCHENP